MAEQRKTCKRCHKPIFGWAEAGIWCTRCADHLTYNNSGGWDEPDEDYRYKGY